MIEQSQSHEMIGRYHVHLQIHLMMMMMMMTLHHLNLPPAIMKMTTPIMSHTHLPLQAWAYI